MNINEISKITGASKQMIRFYEKKGIISPARNPENDYREYTNQEVFNVVVARTYNYLGVKLDQVPDFIYDTDPNATYAFLESKAADLEEEIRWDGERLRFVQDSKQTWDAYRNNIPFIFLKYKDLYFYPNHHDGIYHPAFSKAIVSKAVLRYSHSLYDTDNFATDNGTMLFMKLKEDLKPIHYHDVTVCRTFMRTPNSVLPTGSKIQTLENQLPIDEDTMVLDAFIYMLFRDTATDEDTICVDFLLKQK